MSSDESPDEHTKRRKVAESAAPEHAPPPSRVYNPEAEGRNLYLLGSKQDEEDAQVTLDNYSADQWRHLVESLLSTHLDHSSSEEEVMTAFHMLYQLFCHRYKSRAEVSERMTYIFPDAHALETRKQAIMKMYGMLHFQLLSRHLIDDQDKTGVELYFKLKAIAFNIKTSFEAMVTLDMVMHGGDTLMRAKLSDLTPQLIFRELDPLKTKKHHQVLNFYFRKAFAMGYRKEEDRLYTPIYNKDRRYVCAYEYACTISDFVFGGIYPLEHNEALFACLIDNPQTPKNCIQFLTKFKNEYLPELKRDQSVFAFRNGLFLTMHVKFYHFKKSDGEYWAGDLEGDVVATTYHDMDFDERGMEEDMLQGMSEEFPHKHYMNVKMPEVYKFLCDQGYNTVEIRWIFCFLGRLLFKVGEFDEWGVFIYFIGLAGTGKGTMLRLVMALMDRRDVGILNNELQKTFALDGVADKRVVVGLDIDEAFKLDKATLLSMAVGEDVSVVQKHKQPATLLWMSHLGFAGNTFPRWEDRGGNLGRRFILVECTKPVRNVDTSLFKKALEMKDRFLFVIVSAYMEIADFYKGKGIKEFLPDKFKQAEKRAMQEMNVLLSFVEERCEIENIDDESAPKQFIQSFSVFNKAFGYYCTSHNIPRKNLSNNYMSGVFCRYQVQVVEPGPNDQYGQKTKYLTGLRIKPEFLDGS
jgi:hypothetical protein